MSFAFRELRARLPAGLDWTTADVRILLLDAAAADLFPDMGVSTLADFAPACELDTDGYARQPVEGRAVDLFGTTDPVRLSAADVTFPAVGPTSGGPTIGGAVVYLFDGAGDAFSTPLVLLDDVEGEVNGADVTVSFPTGVVELRHAEA